MIEVPDFLKPLELVTRPFPREAVEVAMARREEVTPHLLAVLEWTATHAEDVPDDYLLHEYALRLLAQFREFRAYELAVRLARHPLADELWGETLSSGLGPILASLSGGDTSLVKILIEDPDADEFARAAGLRALGVLCQSGQLPRAEFSGYLGSLFADGLVRDESFIWTSLVDVCATFGFGEHLAAARRAWDDAMVDHYFRFWDDLENHLNSGVFDEGEEDHFLPADNAVFEMERWHCFTPEAAFDEEEETDEEYEEDLPDDVPSWEERLTQLGERPPPPQPVRAEVKPGRNDPCSCGSGKKYKKCCG